MTTTILFPERADRAGTEHATESPFLGDLNLDQVIAAVTSGREEYDLTPFFFTPLHSVDAVAYRHEVFRDLDGQPLLDRVREFARQMRTMREYLAQADKLRYPYQKKRWLLDAVTIYCAAVSQLASDLAASGASSRGFRNVRRYLDGYVNSGAFRSLVADADHVRDALAEVAYCLHINGPRVRVTKYAEQPDYSADVEQTFAKFKQGAVKDYRAKLANWPDMNHVEAKVLDLVAALHADVFANLDRFCDDHRGYLDPTVAAFDREVQFYVGYLEYIATFTHAGLRFCYPRVSDTSKAVQAAETFDIALANRLLQEHARVVCNDFHLDANERIIVVTGPNQGGKTTLARTFGQLHYLASLGCPIPGTRAKTFLFDHLFTHFEKEEDLSTLSGKLQDDLLRVHGILERATPDSIVILNEIFTSTTLDDALFLGRRILEKIVEFDLLCVCVTFIDELASLSASVVSMVATIPPENPAARTYRVVRRPADGLAYAAALADKYRLSYELLRERVVS